MHALTAIIRAQKGSEALVYAELLKVGAYAREHEPDTIGFFVAQDPRRPLRLYHLRTVHRQNRDGEAQQRGRFTRFFCCCVNNFLDGEVIVVIAKEVWS